MSTTVAFTSAGTKDGIPLVQHACPGHAGGPIVMYVSAAPSPPGADYQVPGCGCRPVEKGAS